MTLKVSELEAHRLKGNEPYVEVSSEMMKMGSDTLSARESFQYLARGKLFGPHRFGAFDRKKFTNDGDQPCQSCISGSSEDKSLTESKMKPTQVWFAAYDELMSE